MDRGEGPFDLADMQRWGKERMIRSAVLRYLLAADDWPVDARGVRLRGVRISGHLDLEGVTLRCELRLVDCYLDAREPVCLDQATAYRLALARCHLAGLTGEMLSAREVDLHGSTLTGPLQLLAANITGQLICRDAQLTGHDDNGDALVADRMKAGGVFLDGEFTAAGAIGLLGADITGQLNCRGAKLTGHDDDGDALVADRMKAGGDVLLDGEFTAAGAIGLVGADITGQLSCRGAKLAGHDNDGNALVADGMKAGGVFLDGEFTAAGAIRLQSVRVGGAVQLCPAALAGPGQVAMDAAGAQIKGELVWAPTGPVFGQVNLEGATISHLVDDWGEDRPGGFWPTEGQLRLDGFTYDRFGGDRQATVEQRLKWICGQYRRSGTGQLGFVSQPYEQLAKVYRRAGKDSDARKVAIARCVDVRRYGSLNWYRKAGNWFMDKTIKFGYQTWRAALGLAVVFMAFLIMTLFAQQHHAIVPVSDLVVGVHPAPAATQCAPSYPCFYPLGYAVDVVIPVINVRQADFWGLNGWGWVAGSWAATVLGWAAVTLLLVGYTGLVRQQ